MRAKVTRRHVGRPAILDVDLDDPRLTFRLEERWYDAFFERYPAAKTAAGLHADLVPALKEAGKPIPPTLLERLKELHPASGIFDGLAHWARLERAHRESAARARAGEIRLGEGITLPARQPMPESLRRLLRRVVHLPPG